MVENKTTLRAQLQMPWKLYLGNRLVAEKKMNLLLQDNDQIL